MRDNNPPCLKHYNNSYLLKQMKNIKFLNITIIISILIMLNHYLDNIILAIIILLLCIYNLIRYFRLRNK
nr:MAG TPA: FeoB-associated Cys-rich membrane protein [Caudoviricetes sp.]